MNSTSMPMPTERGPNIFAKVFFIFLTRYDRQQRLHMSKVYTSMLSTMMACAAGMWLQWKKLCQMNIKFAMLLTAGSIFTTHYFALTDSPTSRYLLCTGFLSGFVLEVYAELAYKAVGRYIWYVILYGFFFFDILLLSALFAPHTPHISRQWVWRLHATLLVASTMDNIVNSEQGNFVLLVSHLVSSFITVPYDIKRLLGRMINGNGNVVSSAMTMFTNLYTVMRDILLLMTMKKMVVQLNWIIDGTIGFAPVPVPE